MTPLDSGVIIYERLGTSLFLRLCAFCVLCAEISERRLAQHAEYMYVRCVRVFFFCVRACPVCCCSSLCVWSARRFTGRARRDYKTLGAAASAAMATMIESGICVRVFFWRSGAVIRAVLYVVMCSRDRISGNSICVSNGTRCATAAAATHEYNHSRFVLKRVMCVGTGFLCVRKRSDRSPVLRTKLR